MQDNGKGADVFGAGVDYSKGGDDMRADVTSLDWNKFAHGKLEVKVNEKTYDAFIKQCEQRNITWHGGRNVDSPWQLYDEMPSFLKAIAEPPNEHIYILAVDGELKWSYKLYKDLDEYEFI